MTREEAETYANEIINALEQESCKYCCNGNQIEKAKLCQRSYLAGMEHKQEPKTGHWQDADYMDEWWGQVYICSECGESMIGKSNYCPDCGARMVEPQERSDKE